MEEEYVKTKLFITIVDKDRTERIVRLFKRYNIGCSCSVNAKGTASGSLLSYFGLDDVKKNVLLSVIPCVLENKLLYLLHNKLELYKPGNGICFSVGITSANKYLSSIYSNLSTYKEEYTVEKDKEYELIILIVSEGYASSAMDAAKRVGANGGTLINGIGLGSEEATKFLGITIEPEKDIVLVLVEKDNKKKVMKEITDAVGLSHEGRGICFSMPVDNVVGLTENVKFIKNDK